MAKWEADWCSKHFRYKINSLAGTKRPIRMTRVKSLAARFHQAKSRQPPAGAHLKRFGHRDEDMCSWCGATVSQMWEHLFCHCSRWRDQQKEQWKAVVQMTGWNAGRCRHVQNSELFSIEVCEKAVMDFLAATEVGKFPLKVKQR